MKKILMPLPQSDFDPTESAVPWSILGSAGFQIDIASPTGHPGQCDLRMLRGDGLGLLAPILKADKNGQEAYLKMSQSESFLKPKTWSEVRAQDYDALILAGGHAPGMKEYLESPILQILVGDFFAAQKIVGAICHGVVLAARSRRPDGKSVLFDRKTTCLLQGQELLAWNLTRWWLGSYYRTYPATVEKEVRDQLQSPQQFSAGPTPLLRDSATALDRGFVVHDKNYISARWPGDAHLFAEAIKSALAQTI